MPYRIGVISPSLTMTERFQQAIARKNLTNFILRQGNKNEALQCARELIDEGARVFISRGQTARAIRSAIDVPVVDVRHTFFDCYNAYRRAREISDKVAFLATSEQFAQTIHKSRHLMDGVEMAEIRDSDDVQATLHMLKQRGFRVMIGGLTLKEKVEALDCVYIMTETDEDSVRDSIEEAQYFLRIEIERDEQAQELENRYETIVSIFQCVSDAVVSIDKNGIISNANTKAIQILGKRAIGKSIAAVLDTQLFAEILRTGAAITREVITFNHHSLLINAEVIRVNNEINGATVTLQQTKNILAAEQKIRSVMFGKGHRSDKTFNDIIGESAALQETKTLAKKYAVADGTVLLLGETGTGKELFAQSIHNASRRYDAPFVAINCASLPLNILESELFGYVKGAFTGARSEGKAGFFELAHHGTIFLDEISETPLDVQLKLLRVLQERKTMRIGDDKLIPIDVRIITASNKDLPDLIRKGLFREDLYYRICVLEVHIPPLRERREDIPALVRHFMRLSAPHITHITPAAIASIASREWPGNIRQLQNCIERIGAMCEDQAISLETVEKALRGGSLLPADLVKPVRAPAEALRNDTAAATEMELIRQVLMEVKGNRKQAAERLGISTTTLWRTMKKIMDKDAGYFDLVKYGDIS